MRNAIRTTRVVIPRVNFRFATGTVKKDKKWWEVVDDETVKAVIIEKARK